MLERLKYPLSVACYFARLSVQRQIEYPSFLLFWLIGNPLNYLSEVWMLSVVVQSFQALNGWTFPQIAFLYGLSMLSHGFMVVFFIQTWHIEYLIRRGGFDRMLLRPMSVLFQFVISNINLIGITDLIPGVIIFLYGCIATGFQWTLPNILKLVLVVAGAVLIRGAFYSIVGSIAFWTKSSRFLITINMSLMAKSTLYPLSIYPHVLQLIFTFIIPFGFISFYPACDFLGKDSGFGVLAGLALWTPVVGLLLSLFASILFNKGLKIYESAGS